MDVITAEQRAELVDRLHEKDRLMLADVIEQCGTINGEDCELCAALYEMEMDPN